MGTFLGASTSDKGASEQSSHVREEPLWGITACVASSQSITPVKGEVFPISVAHSGEAACENRPAAHSCQCSGSGTFPTLRAASAAAAQSDASAPEARLPGETSPGRRQC